MSKADNRAEQLRSAGSEAVQNNHRAILKLWPLLAGTNDQKPTDNQ